METPKLHNIKQWALEDRPREKMLLKGPRALSNAELLAILIATGTRDETAVDLSMNMLAVAGNNLNNLGKKSLVELQKTKGIGEAKAVTIMAALELGRRRRLEEAKETRCIKNSSQAFEYMQPLLCDLQHEEFWIMFLNRANMVIEHVHLSTGGISGTVIDVKIILKRCVELLASSIVLCHNHPSGNLKPSSQDMDITSRIKQAAAFFDVTIIDHLIVGDNSYFSFADEGLL